MFWGHGLSCWGGHWPGGIMMMIFWILVLVGLVLLARRVFIRSGEGSAVGLDNPEETLKRRYAKGEIDKAEFEQKRKDISG